MENLNLKVPQNKVLELYGLSRSSFYHLTKRLKLTKYYFGEGTRKPYYDLKEIEAALLPKSEK